MPDLDPNGGRVELGRLVLHTSNLEGDAEVIGTGTGGGTRDEVAPSRLESGLFEVPGPDGRPMVRQTDAVVINAASLRAAAGGPSRSVEDGTAVRLDVPSPPPDHEQAVLAVDESGVTTWSFAPTSEQGRANRDGSSRTFIIPRPPAGSAGEAEGGDRGGIGDIRRQVLKVITFPIGVVAGKVANTFMEHWEGKHLQYGVREYLASNYTQPAEYFDSQPAKWRELAKGRTLLMIHGTFSRAHGAFHALPADRMAHIQQLYGGRVIAFDHFTVSDSPQDNIKELIARIPEGTSIDLDIVCHSRGGLVARSLTEWAGDFPGGRDIRVHRTALVGTVNNGTILADVAHWNDLIDMLSTLINTVGLGIPQPFELVLSFAQDIAEAGYPQLPGLHAMVPGGPFLKGLNARRPRMSEYLAIASNYEPVEGGVKAFLNDSLKDLLFDRKDNDAMVRVDSVCGTDGDDEFRKVADVELIDATKGIEHSRYFGEPQVVNRVVSWLEAGL